MLAFDILLKNGGYYGNLWKTGGAGSSGRVTV